MRQRKIERGEFLRNLYDVQATSPIANRDLRNHLEHFDERLDAFFVDAAANGLTAIVDKNITPVAAVPNSLGLGAILRHLDPNTLNFIFRGVSYDLQTIYAQAIGIREQSIAFLATDS
jgi:hypothetical protein